MGPDVAAKISAYVVGRPEVDESTASGATGKCSRTTTWTEGTTCRSRIRRS